MTILTVLALIALAVLILAATVFMAHQIGWLALSLSGLGGLLVEALAGVLTAALNAATGR